MFQGRTIGEDYCGAFPTNTVSRSKYSDSFTFVLLLNACKFFLGFEHLKMASKLMNRRFVESGCGADVFCGGGRVVAWLTCMFSKCGSMEEDACRGFNKIAILKKHSHFGMQSSLDMRRSTQVTGNSFYKCTLENACAWWAMYILEKPMSTSFTHMGAECLC
jgi:hypothetical protein